MLCLGRRVGEEIHLSNGVIIRVLKVKDGRIRVGIEAPEHIKIWRGEIESEIIGTTLEKLDESA